MTRTTISIPDDVRKRLRLMAAERGVSLSTVIREALEEKAASERPKPSFFGLFDSGQTDTARKASDLKLEPREWRTEAPGKHPAKRKSVGMASPGLGDTSQPASEGPRKT
jgi:plasmid stability protein